QGGIVQVGRTRCRQNMYASDFVWCDLDPDPSKPLDQERARIFELLTVKLPVGIPKPTYIIDSGRGYWALWKLADRHLLDGREGESTQAFEAALRGIIHALGGDPNTSDSSRIIRLPGTVNAKTQKLADVVAHNRVSYKLSDFPAIVKKRKPRTRAGEAEPISE